MENLDTVNKGDTVEAIVLAKLKSLGYTVLKPWGDNQRYDFVIENEDGFERVQVKKANYNGKSVECRVSGNHSNMNKINRKTYDKSEIDSFIFYVNEKNDFIYIDVEETPEYNITFRYSSEQNQQHINWVNDYKLQENI
jgi:hypothetical protein